MRILGRLVFVVIGLYGVKIRGLVFVGLDGFFYYGFSIFSVVSIFRGFLSCIIL